MLDFESIVAKPYSYGRIRSYKEIKYIVIHYTGNRNDKAINNAKYYATSNTRYAGAHYYIDEGDIVYKSVPVNRVAWAVGGRKYSDCYKTGGGKLYGKCTNTNSISIELCDSFTKNPKIEENCVELVKFLMKKYDIDIYHVVRHFDVTGKHCPSYLCNNKEWTRFKHMIVPKTYNPVTSIDKDSSKSEIIRLQTTLNKYNVGLPKLVCDGVYGTRTRQYLLKLWDKWNWNGSATGWCAGTKTLTKLGIIK